MSATMPIYRNKVRLNKPQDVQKFPARTANMLIDDEISDGKARAIGYLCQIMLKGFETVDLQQINELQEFIDELEKSSESSGW